MKLSTINIIIAGLFMAMSLTAPTKPIAWVCCVAAIVAAVAAWIRQTRGE